MSDVIAETVPLSRPEPSHARAATPIDSRVGLAIRMRRIELDLSQEKVAGELGITAQQLQKYERGANRVGASRLYELAQILNVNVQYFFPDEKKTSPHINGTTGPAPGKMIAALEDASTLRLLRLFSSLNDQSMKNRVISLIEAVTIDK